MESTIVLYIKREDERVRKYVLCESDYQYESEDLKKRRMSTPSLDTVEIYSSHRVLFMSKERCELLDYLKKLLVLDETTRRIRAVFDYSRTTLPELPGGPNEVLGFVKGYFFACAYRANFYPHPNYGVSPHELMALEHLLQQDREEWGRWYSLIRQHHPVVLFVRRYFSSGFIAQEVQP